MFNILTLTEVGNKLIVSAVRMVGETAEINEGDLLINEYRTDLMGCEVVHGDVISESGEVLHTLNGVHGE